MIREKVAMPRSGSTTLTTTLPCRPPKLITIVRVPAFLTTVLTTHAGSPPFYPQGSPSVDTSRDAKRRQSACQYHNDGLGDTSCQARLVKQHTGESTTADFRGVIDDLTIENKTLRRKLRMYERTHDAHLRNQKLFEVRVHGMPLSKKRELEGILKTFAMGLQSSQHSQYDMQNSAGLPLIREKSSSSLASTSNPFVDSAYVSGGGPSMQGSNSKSKHMSSRLRDQYIQTKRQNVQSYLHDIPEGLLPRRATAMTDASKKKLVVRRLEYIFGGRMAEVHGHQQHVQQQELSHMAAKDEHSAITTLGQGAPPEGVREARIMLDKDKSKMRDAPWDSSTVDGVASQDFAQPCELVPSVSQRPTRPLDLDPQRAQVPADNVEYIQHLGFSPPNISSSSSPEEGHGWLYLNLLINMAQLHTVNVTTEFVQQAIKDYSKRFELSKDGRKVRWRGGADTMKTSSNDDWASDSAIEEQGSPRKRMKRTKLLDQGIRSSIQRKMSEALAEKAHNKLSYTPLFQHRSSDGDDLSSSASDMDELGEAYGEASQLDPGAASTMTNSRVNSNNLKRKRAQEKGPIIFYNNANFCTDLCGDLHTEDMLPRTEVFYHALTTTALGTEPPKLPGPFLETRGPLDSAIKLPSPVSLFDKAMSLQKGDLHFPAQSPLTHGEGKGARTYNLEASGIGGVFPADNFAINVQAVHTMLDHAAVPGLAYDGVPKRYPTAITQILLDHGSRSSRRAFHKQVVSAEHESLPPAKLPPASCFMSSNESPDPTEENFDACSVSISLLSDHDAPTAAPQRIEMDYVSSQESDDGYSTASSDDGSVDLLATARELDPEAIRKGEMEYDANMAERLADDIPAGSSAATAGGGSGFNSPRIPSDQRKHTSIKLPTVLRTDSGESVVASTDEA